MPEESPGENTAVIAPEPALVELTSTAASGPGFLCDCTKNMRTACNAEPFYGEHEGKRYCVLHYPGKEKDKEFQIALRNKIEAGDFNFCGVWFPRAVNFHSFEFGTPVDFRHATFSSSANFISATFKAEAIFSSATFSNWASFSSATFEAETNFSAATFNDKVHFHSTIFSGPAYFISAIFKAKADFRSATFKVKTYFSSSVFRDLADFHYVTFDAKTSFNSVAFDGEADFTSATSNSEMTFILAAFNAGAKFRTATLKDRVDFSGILSFRERAALDLRFTRIEKPERLSFHTVALRPHWFVDVDPRKFVFTDAQWNWKTFRITGEIQSLKERSIESPHHLLAIACRQLAENAEANNRYEEASRFRYLAMDAMRVHKWQGWSFWKTDWLHMLYWAISGYGERFRRAFVWLLGVWVVFAVLFTQVGFTKSEDKSAAAPDTVGQPLPLKRAFTYSLGVMSLQRPEPKPVTGTAQTLVTLETILGPLQAALLALAIRRKFMR